MFLLLQFGAHRYLKCRVVLTEPARGRKPDPMPFHLLFEPVVVGTCSCSPLLRLCFLCLTRAHVLLGFPFFASSVSSGQSPTSPLFMRVRLHLPYFSLLFCFVVTSLVMLLPPPLFLRFCALYFFFSGYCSTRAMCCKALPDFSFLQQRSPRFFCFSCSSSVSWTCLFICWMRSLASAVQVQGTVKMRTVGKMSSLDINSEKVKEHQNLFSVFAACLLYRFA